MKRLLAWIALALLCGGCASAAFRDIDAKFQAFKGRPVSDLTAALGPPDTENRVGDELWYVWRYRSLDGYRGDLIDMQCQLSALVVAGTVTRARWNGNLGGCSRMAASIR